MAKPNLSESFGDLGSSGSERSSSYPHSVTQSPGSDTSLDSLPSGDGVPHRDAVAVVGLSLKFPEDATSSEGFWNMLMEGRCASKEFPRDRLNISSFHHEDANREDSLPMRGGHFLTEDISRFDAPFFSISDAEASGMDPQQRLLLETTYRALENAGIPLETCAGSKTSVHTGSFTNDYKDVYSKDPELLPGYAATGVPITLLANRISWFFNFQGASANIDTACSSSLVALDMSCKSLINGETNMGVVAGSSLIFAPDMMYLLSSMNMLSQDSRCFSFDHRANGYARGEGVGVVLLKRLSDAIAAGDTIRAVIRGTGTNQDGFVAGVGITNPNPVMQEALVRETYRKAGLATRLTRYFEAHGTGTAAGDPIESRALGNVFREGRSEDDPLYVGAVKSNIGHLEGASGLAGLIKTILILERGIIPPNANFEKVNPRIDEQFWKIKFPSKATPWPREGLRRASLNSFGIGGTNAHVIVDDAAHYLMAHGLRANHCTVQHPPSLQDSDTLGSWNPTLKQECDRLVTSPRSKILLLSAADEAGIKRIGETYTRHFSASQQNSRGAETSLDDLAYTLDSRRSLLPWKSYIVANSTDQLRDFADLLSKPVKAEVKPTLGLVFTGQGAQWARMGLELISFPLFKQSLDKSEALLREIGCQWSLQEELRKEKTESDVDRPDHSQPMCTAIQVALMDLLWSFGVRPAGVVGHSSGEIAAAYSIGAISHRSSIKIAYFRGVLAEKLTEPHRPQGAMMAVGLPASQARVQIEELASESGKHGIVVGCINSPRSVTLSGDRDQIDTEQEILAEKDIFARKLQVDVAYHSHLMDPIAKEYLQCIQGIEKGDFNSPAVMVSSVTGRYISSAELRQGEYWVSNMTSTVRFAEALGILSAQSASKKKIRPKLDGSHQTHVSIDTFIEIGPHAALQGPSRDIFKSSRSEANYLSVLVRHTSGLKSLLDAVGSLYCQNYPVDLTMVNRPEKTTSRPRLLIDLPEYSFNHKQSYWYENRISKGQRHRKWGRFDLLGTPTPDWNPITPKWRNFLKESEMPWLRDHQVNGTTLYPGAGMLVMAIEAANQVTAEQDRTITGFTVKEATFHNPLLLSSSPQGTETELHLRAIQNAEKDSSTFQFRLHAYINDLFTEICDGTIIVEYQKDVNEVSGSREDEERHLSFRQAQEAAEQQCLLQADRTNLYKCLDDCGFNFGETFQSMQEIFHDGKTDARATVKCFQWPTEQFPQSHIIHPTTLDGLMNICLAAITNGGTESTPTLIPTAISSMWISKEGLSHPAATLVTANGHFERKDTRSVEVSVSVTDSSKETPLAQINLHATAVASIDTSDEADTPKNQLCYNTEWKPDVELLDKYQITKLCDIARPDETELVEFFQDLAFVQFMFISKTLEALEVTQTSGPMPDHYEKYIAWMKYQTRRYKVGELPHAKEDWEALLLDASFCEQLCNKVEKTNWQGKLHVLVGRNLIEILNGEVDPLTLFFGPDDLLGACYREVNDTGNCLRSFARYLDMVVHKTPNMKILEVGAGTGGSTVPIMEVIGPASDNRRYGQYDFTDVSTYFLEKARQTFSDQDAMKFSILNIEEDPIDQGFKDATYDMVIAANVLHATKDINKTMRNVRRLLKPGGKLMLYEVTRPEITRTGFGMGLLDGWWLSTEPYRTWSPCMDKLAWGEILRANDFSGVDFSFRDFEDDVSHEIDVMISTATEPLVFSEAPKLKSALSVSIIVERDAAVQAKMAASIKAELLASGTIHCKVRYLDEIKAAPPTPSRIDIVLVELDQPFLSNINAARFQKLKTLLASSLKTFWVSGGVGKSQPEFAQIDGLSNVLRQEDNLRTFVTVALDAEHTSQVQQLRNICKVLELTDFHNEDGLYEPAYKYIDGTLQVKRMTEVKGISQNVANSLLPYESKMQPFGQAPPLELSIQTPGLFDTLRFTEDTGYSKPLAVDDVEVHVRAVGLNFKDCLIALGRVGGSLGLECAGLVSRCGLESGFKIGDRVCVVTSNAFRSHARVPAKRVVRVPDNVSLDVAACLPITFVTAYQAIHKLAQMEEGESILIHSGAGGTGQAAIQMCKAIGAEIFVTVGSVEKKQLLMDEYHIPEDHIFYSRDASFADGVKRMTNNRGVDVVFNSLAGESLIASWECIAPYGRFIEIGRAGILSNNKLPMAQFEKNVSFHALETSLWMQDRPTLGQKATQHILDQFSEGHLHPAHPFQVHPVSEVSQAFRTMQEGKTIGKTVISISDDDIVPTYIKPKPTFDLSSDGTYVIAGGLGGLGMSIARWMVSRGARNLLLLSRSGPRNQEHHEFLRDLRAQGITVEAPPSDITNASVLKSALEKCAQTMPVVKGLIQSTMVLNDAAFQNMEFEAWKMAVEPKVTGSWNLHNLLPKDLDFCVYLSSISGVVGLFGQSNYAAGNTYMDALAAYRLANGMKAISLDLGAMTDSGWLAEHDGIRERLMLSGHLLPISQPELFALLNYYCDPARPLPAPTQAQTIIGFEIPENIRARGREFEHWFRTAPFSHLHNIRGTAAMEVNGDASEQATDFKKLFLEASSHVEAGDVITDAIVKKLALTLSSLRESDVDVRKPMHTYGVDSLLAVELRNWFAKDFAADVAVFEILGGASFAAVGMAVASKSRLKGAAWSE